MSEKIKKMYKNHLKEVKKENPKINYIMINNTHHEKKDKKIKLKEF